MLRIVALVLLGGLGIVLFPGRSSAQFMPVMAPPNSVYSLPGYQYQFSIGGSVPTVYGRTFVGVTNPFTPAPQLFSPNWGMEATAPYPWWQSGMSSGYIYGGGRSGYDAQAAQRGLAAAQQAATRARRVQDDAKELIAAQWAYEALGVKGQSAVQGALNQAENLQKALAVRDEAAVASGAALNPILVAIVAAEAKGAKGVSPFLPPVLLDEIRFAGGPAADLLNLLRQSGKVPFPAAFDDPALKDLRVTLQLDFKAATAPLLAGKPLDPLKVLKLEATLKRVETVAPPVIREQTFEDAIAARKFLNQLDSAVRALKGSAANGIVDPKWATEGTNVSDLVKHLTKYKLMFGLAPAGSESTYLALHRALATYLVVLSQPKK